MIPMIEKKKSLGQHFISDFSILNREAGIVDCKDKNVLEIGPGDGRLSELLLEASTLYLVEKDERFAHSLKERFAHNGHVHVIVGDFLDLEPLVGIDVVVGNLPYYISSAITFRLLDWNFKRAVLMYQKEFAEKMTAQGKDKSRLSFFVQHYFDIRRHFVVPRSAFSPRPKVDSMLVELMPRKNAEMIDEETRAIITSLFQHRLKTLNASLRQLCKRKIIDKQHTATLCAGFDCTKRIFQFTNDEILSIGKELAKLPEQPR